MKTFSLNGILWKQTFQVNVFRTVVAGIVWAVVGFIILSAEPGKGNPFIALLMPVCIPIGYFLFYLPLGIAAGFLSRLGIPFIGLLSFIPAIIIYPADPFVFFLHKAKPELVPVDNYRFIEPVLSIWVYNRHTPM